MFASFIPSHFLHRQKGKNAKKGKGRRAAARTKGKAGKKGEGKGTAARSKPGLLAKKSPISKAAGKKGKAAGKPASASGKIAMVAKKAASANGVSGTFDGFLMQSASAIASGSAHFGNQITDSFLVDREQLKQNTPAISASMQEKGDTSVSAAKEPKQAKPPKPKFWRAPKHRKSQADTPEFSPTGEANPGSVESSQQQSAEQARASGQQFSDELSATPGQERVKGRNMSTKRHARLSMATAKAKTKRSPAMSEYLDLPLPGNVRSMVDSEIAPRLDQSTAASRGQVASAIKERESKHEAALAQAREKADSLSDKASQEQSAELKSAKLAIEEQKAAGMQEAKQEVDAVQSKLGSEKDGAMSQINGKIDESNKKANQLMDDANKEANEKQREADKKVEEQEREKAKAKKKKKKKSIWGKITSWVGKALKSISKTIKSIVNKVKQVVKTIIRKATSLAKSVINACSRFVAGAIKAFAAVAKALTATLLVAFPAIQAKVNAFIDKAAQKAAAAVQKVADTLNAQLDKVADTLNQLVDFAANFVETMVDGAAMLTMAILNGDFDSLPKIAFIMACKSVGLPGEQFYQMLSKAGSQLLHIIKNPVSFLSNLIKAGNKGFQQFLSKIVVHVKSGLMGWLFGQIGDSGLTIPKSFDAATVFTTLRQMLGLTFEYVKARAISIIGAKNAERLEAVLSVVKQLFTDGPAAVFGAFKEEYEQLKPDLLSQIQDWAVTQVVQKGMIKVSSMLIPGSGFVQAIYGMWQTIQFFKDKCHTHHGGGQFDDGLHCGHCARTDLHCSQ